MKTIAIALPNLAGGGAERVCIDLANEFNKLGYISSFALMSATGELLNEAQEKFVVDDLAAPRIRNAPGAVAKFLAHRRPDAFIANMWPLTSAAVIGRALSGHKCRLLLVEHASLTHQYSKRGQWHSKIMQLSIIATYGLADHVAAVSKGAALEISQISRLDSSRIKVLYNPIPKRPWPSDQALKEVHQLWNCPNGRRILSVGSFKDEKNHEMLLRAFSIMAGKHDRLLLLGKGENEATLRSIANYLGIDKQVIFPGFRIDPSPFYATADLFVLTSNYEGLANVLIEALSFGLPVVATDCPHGPSEILENGRWGRLVPVGDYLACAGAISDALNSYHDKPSLKKRADFFDPKTSAAQYLRLLV